MEEVFCYKDKNIGELVLNGRSFRGFRGKGRVRRGSIWEDCRGKWERIII